MSADTTTLESMCELIVDCPHSTPEWTDSGYLVTRNQNIKNGVLHLSSPSFTNEQDYLKRIKRAKPKSGDIIFTREAPMGEVCMIPEGLKCCLGQRQVLLRPKKNVCGEYLFWALQSPFVQHQISWNEGTGSTVSNVRIPVLKALNIPRQLGEEEDIAKVLSDLAGKIQLNRQTNQTLEQIAQAMFKSWFVDFDPTRAKIAAKQTGQDPERAAMAAISGKALDQLDNLPADTQQQLKTTAALFPDALVDSELGEIPEGWRAEPFGNLLTKTIGGDWGKEEPDDKHTEKVKILRGTDLPNVYAGSDGKVPTRYVDPKKLATRKLEAGDIVIEVSGGSPTQPTGRSLYLAQEIIERLNMDLEPASFCRLFRPIDREVGLILGLHLQIIYANGKTWLYQNTSTGISNFQTKVFLDKELVIIPNEDLKQHFYKLVMPYFQKIYSGENKALSELRDSLLPKLLSGELSIG